MPVACCLQPRTNANNRLYAEAAAQLGRELGVPVVDMQQAMRTQPGFGKAMYLGE